MESVVKIFNETGACEIHVDKVINQWSHLWWIDQYKNRFRLIKYRRKDSPITVLKVGISTKQAYELIRKLNLHGTRDDFFRHSKSWRK